MRLDVCLRLAIAADVRFIVGPVVKGLHDGGVRSRVWRSRRVSHTVLRPRRAAGLRRPGAGRRPCAGRRRLLRECGCAARGTRSQWLRESALQTLRRAEHRGRGLLGIQRIGRSCLRYFRYFVQDSGKIGSPSFFEAIFHLDEVALNDELCRLVACSQGRYLCLQDTHPFQQGVHVRIYVDASTEVVVSR